MTVRLVLRPWFLAQWLLLITGLLAVGYTAVNLATLYVYQAYETRVFDQAVALRPAAPPVAEAGPTVVRSLVGKIEIPRLKISAMVREGADDRTLDIGTGHIPHTALPGQTGNVGVAAHRDTLFSQFERCAARRQDYADHARRRVRLSRRLIQSRQADGGFRPRSIRG